MRGLAALVLMAGLPVACGDDDGGESTDTTGATTDTTAASTTTTQDPEAEVEAAYLAYWEMNKRLAAAPDPDDDEINARATGSARDDLVDGLTTLAANGERVAFGDAYAHDVLSVTTDGEAATVRDCYVDDAARIDQRTGEVLESATATNLIEASLRLETEEWKVEQLRRLNVWDGVRTCA